MVCAVALLLCGYAKSLQAQYRQWLPAKTVDETAWLAGVSAKDKRQLRRESRRGDAFLQWDYDYRKAGRAYQKALKYCPGHSLLQLKAGVAGMLAGNKQLADAWNHLEKAAETDNLPVKMTALKLLAHMHHRYSRWDLALEYYRKCLQVAPEKDKAALEKALAACQNGKLMASGPRQRNYAENAGNRVNSSFDDFAPVLNATGDVLFMTSRRDDSTGGETDSTGQFFEDIYEARQSAGSWRRPRNAGELNTPGHEGTAGLSVTEKLLVIYRGRNNGDLYYTRFSGKEWGKPQPLPADVNSPWRETSACLSADGRKLFFTSDRPGGQGGLDIYLTEKTAMGWSKPRNLGETINTAEDEDGVSLSTDGKTLYFSSRGHNSMGGFDVFASEITNEGFGPARNLGIPVNSPADDLHIWFVSDSLAWLGSDRPGGKGGLDLYTIAFAGEPLQWQLGNWQWLQVSAAPAWQQAADDNINNLLQQLAPEKPVTSLADVTEATSLVVLKAITFNSGEATLQPGALDMLQQVGQMLRKHPDWKLEISGHTDNTGSKSGNRQLSEERAGAVAAFLRQQGIAPERLLTRGLGDTRPVASNDTPEGKEQNRRIEFRIIREAQTEGPAKSGDTKEQK